MKHSLLKITLMLLGTGPVHLSWAQPKPVGSSAAAIGSRVEMMVDGWLIDATRTRGAALSMQTPVRREVVLTMEKPWEGPESAYFTVIQDGPRIRLYYRGFIPPGGDNSDEQLTCYAESTDGVHFERPNLGLYAFQDSKNNNITYKGVEAHNFTPFLDTNPQAKAEERYKAVGGLANRLCGFVSPDGLRWKKIQPEPVMTQGQFDSQNVVFWDSQVKLYRCYSRTFTGPGATGYRIVQESSSQDFIHWTSPIPNHYRLADGSQPPQEHFYTNATTPCPGAPHHYLSFPMRFFPDRTKPSVIKDPGVSDALFLSSRDGLTWEREFREAWVRPGLDQRNWTHRNNMTAVGIVQTDPSEFSMYISEHYAWPGNRLRRLSLRRFGFASMHANQGGGEFTTRPLTFTGAQLFLNYATSAAGSIQVEVQDEQGQPLAGYTLEESPLLFGDELEAAAKWKSGKSISDLKGKSIRLRFLLKDADLFALRFQ